MALKLVTRSPENLSPDPVLRVTSGDKWVTGKNATCHPLDPHQIKAKPYRVTSGDKFVGLIQLYEYLHVNSVGPRLCTRRSFENLSPDSTEAS